MPLHLFGLSPYVPVAGSSIPRRRHQDLTAANVATRAGIFPTPAPGLTELRISPAVKALRIVLAENPVSWAIWEAVYTTCTVLTLGVTPDDFLPRTLMWNLRGSL